MFFKCTYNLSFAPYANNVQEFPSYTLLFTHKQCDMIIPTIFLIMRVIHRPYKIRYVQLYCLNIYPSIEQFFYHCHPLIIITSVVLVIILTSIFYRHMTQRKLDPYVYLGNAYYATNSVMILLIIYKNYM